MPTLSSLIVPPRTIGPHLSELTYCGYALDLTTHVGFLAFSFPAMSLSSNAQSNCPQGFVFVGSLSGTVSQTEEFDKRVDLQKKLPEGATLDKSFQQRTVRATNAKGKANLRAQDSVCQ
jgi:hypothetical protein